MRSNMSRITFSLLALALLLSGCASSSAKTPNAIGTWGEQGAGEPNLTLGQDGSLSGTDGCNRLMGSWTQDGVDLEFGNVAATLMFCEGVDTWLSSLASATLDTDTLILHNASGKEIGSLKRA